MGAMWRSHWGVKRQGRRCWVGVCACLFIPNRSPAFPTFMVGVLCKGAYKGGNTHSRTATQNCNWQFIAGLIDACRGFRGAGGLSMRCCVDLIFQLAFFSAPSAFFRHIYIAGVSLPCDTAYALNRSRKAIEPWPISNVWTAHLSFLLMISCIAPAAAGFLRLDRLGWTRGWI
jgi:hypothetical protein